MSVVHPELVERILRTEYGQAAAIRPGVCRFCGCTDDQPCELQGYAVCEWVDEQHTICSACVDRGLEAQPLTPAEHELARNLYEAAKVYSRPFAHIPLVFGDSPC